MSSSPSTTPEYEPSADGFKVSPNLYLGNSYRQYKETMHLHAVSSPEQYAQIRKVAVQKIKADIMEKLFELNDVLSVGKLGHERVLPFAPFYPPQKINEILFPIASNLSEVLDNIVDIVVPPFESLEQFREEKKKV